MVLPNPGSAAGAVRIVERKQPGLRFFVTKIAALARETLRKP